MNKRKTAGPVIISLLIIVYYGAIVAVFLKGGLPFKLPPAIRVVLIVLPLVVAGVMVYVLIERIKEIRSGEEDDLGNY